MIIKLWNLKIDNNYIYININYNIFELKKYIICDINDNTIYKNNIIDDNFTIKLYDFQKKDINKILHIENNKNNLSIKHFYNTNVNNIYYDYINHIYTFNNNKSININTNGCILCEKKGFGKSIIIIALIYLSLKNKYKNLIIVPKYLLNQWKELINR
jgi:hypothetical protein